MNAQDLKYVLRAKRAGARYPWTLVNEARKAGIQVSLALAICEQETNFQNVFGHDPTIFAGAGKVTKAKYLAYRARRGPKGRGGMQGVGPMQLTYYSFQDQADRLGGCWRPTYNIRVGLELLASNIHQHGEFQGIAAYNGSGRAAQQYAFSVLRKRDRWHNVLTKS